MTATLFERPPREKLPSWAPFLDEFPKLKVPKSPVHAYVLIICLRISRRSVWYAIPFGPGGRYLIVDSAIDYEMPLDIARRETLPGAHMRGPGRLRQFQTKQIGDNVLSTQKRSSRDANLNEMFFDRYSEILTEIYGKPRNTEILGTSITGGQSLGLRRKLTLDDLPILLTYLEDGIRDVRSREYAGNEAAMRRIDAPDLIKRLDEILVAAFRDPRDARISFGIPDFAGTDEVSTISFSRLGSSHSRQYFDDIDLKVYQRLLMEAGRWDDVDLKYLHEAQVALSEPIGRRYSVYRCLYGAFEEGDAIYVHHDRFWYRIPESLQQEINEYIAGIEEWTAELPTPSIRIMEGAYNDECARARDIVSLDRRTIGGAKGETQIEVCDLLTEHENHLAMIHIKRDFASSSLSHLFNQGRVSAALLQEVESRNRVREHVARVMAGKRPRPAWFKRLSSYLAEAPFATSDIEIVYGILGDWQGEDLATRLPFFSKLMLHLSARELRGSGFVVKYKRIEMPGPTPSPGTKKRRSTAFVASSA